MIGKKEQECKLKHPLKVPLSTGLEKFCVGHIPLVSPKSPFPVLKTNLVSNNLPGICLVKVLPVGPSATYHQLQVSPLTRRKSISYQNYDEQIVLCIFVTQ